MLALWGVAEVRPDDFDIVCTVGMGTKVVTFAGAFRRNQELASPDELRAAARRSVSASVAGQIVRTLRQITSRPVIVIQTPAVLPGWRAGSRGVNGAGRLVNPGLRQSQREDEHIGLPDHAKAGSQMPLPVRNDLICGCQPVRLHRGTECVIEAAIVLPDPVLGLERPGGFLQQLEQPAQALRILANTRAS